MWENAEFFVLLILLVRRPTIQNVTFCRPAIQNVPFFVSLNVAALSHRKSASPGISRDIFRVQVQNNGDILQQSLCCSVNIIPPYPSRTPSWLFSERFGSFPPPIRASYLVCLKLIYSIILIFAGWTKWFTKCLVVWCNQLPFTLELYQSKIYRVIQEERSFWGRIWKYRSF